MLKQNDATHAYVQKANDDAFLDTVSETTFFFSKIKLLYLKFSYFLRAFFTYHIFCHIYIYTVIPR